MNRYSVFSIIALLLFSACQKVDLNEYIEEKEEGCELTFNLGRYTIGDFDDADGETSGANRQMRKTRKAVNELGTVVNFAVFQNGEKVKTVNQKKTDEGFGTIKIALPAGNYQIVALVHSGTGNATVTSTDKITFANNKVTDTFCHFSDLAVSESKSVDINLDRVVSMFRFTVEDEIPSDVSQMQFYYTGGSSTLNAENGLGCVNSRQTEIREVTNHSAGQVFEVYTFPHEMQDVLNMTITALDAGGNEYSVKSLPDIPVEYQKVTNCSMPFFSGSAGSQSGSWTLYGDDAWKGEINY